MDELLTFLLGAACILAVVTVVGHGIWVVLAAIVRAMEGSNARSQLPERKPCPHCGARFGIEQGRCVVCGAVPQLKPRSSLREELLATARQINRLQANGALSQEQYDQLAALISADLQELDGNGATKKFSSTSLVMADDAVAAEVIEDAAVPRRSPASASTSVPHRPQVELSPSTSSPEDFVVVRSNVSADTTADSPFAAPTFARTHDSGTAQPIAAAPSAPPPPKLSDMLQSFLEESNIRWGEILAGFFIVVSSIGLVISLQSTLEKIPYFPALLFTGFTVAFHGAGLYTLKRWNLHAVSRVVLVISLLLVPLTASAAVLMSRRGVEEAASAPPALFWIVLAIGTVALTWVAYTSSRELVGQAKWRLTVAVVGCSLAEVLVHRLAIATFDFWRLSAVAILPLSCFLIAVVGQLIQGRRWRHMSWPRAQQTLIVLGVGLFALLVAVAMLLMKADPRWLAAARLAPSLSLAAGATMAVGLLIHRRTTAGALAGLRTAGTVILILGGAVIVLMVVLAWPEPELLLGVGLVNAMMLLALAVAADLPLLYAPAVACLTLASVIGLHWLQGRFVDVPRERLGITIVEAALMGRSSLVLLVLALATATAAETLRRKKWLNDAQVLFAVGGVVALLGVLIATFSGFITIPHWSQDQNLAAPVLLVYAVALLAAAPFAPWPYVASAGSAILFVALLQAFAFNASFRELLDGRGLLPKRALLAAVISHALVSAAILIGTLRKRLFDAATDSSANFASTLGRNFIEPLSMGTVVSLVAAIPLLFVGRPEQMFEAAIAALLASLGWGAVVLATRWKPAVAGLQSMLILAPALAIGHDWHAEIGRDWFRTFDHVAMQCAVLAIGTAPWALLRRTFNQKTTAGDLLRADWPTVDEIVLGIATVLVAAIAWMLAVPDVAWELGYDELATLLTIDSEAAMLSPTLWVILTSSAILIALGASLWERVRLLPLVGLAVVTFALVAGSSAAWESDVAVASAIRWWAGVYTIGWGLVFIARRPIHLAARSLGWLRWERIDRPTAHAIFGAVPMVFGALPILILTILAVLQSAGGVDLRGPIPDSFFDRIGPTASYAVPLLAIVGVLLGYAVREREAAFALGGSAIFQLAANLAFLLYVTFAPAAASEVRAAEWLQWNAVAAGGFAIVWLALLRWMLPRGVSMDESSEGKRAGSMLAFQIAVAALGMTALACWSAWSVASMPQLAAAERQVLGGVLSYASIGLVCTAAAWLAMLFRAQRQVTLGNVALVLATGGIAFIAATVDRYDIARNWLAYHTLSGGWLAVLGAATIAWCTLAPHNRLRPAQPRWITSLAPHHGFIAGLSLLVAMLAIRGNLADPGEPWWSFAGSLGVMLATAAVGLRRGSQPYAYASVAATTMTMVLLWTAPAQAAWRASLGDDMAAVFIELLSLTMLAAATFWQMAEIFSQTRTNRSLDAGFPAPRSHDTVLIGLLPVYFLWRLGNATFASEPGDLFSYSDLAGIATVIGWGIALTASLWDRRAVLTLPSLFVWLGAVALLAIGLAGPQIPKVYDRIALMTLAAGLLVAVSGQAWSYGANLSLIGLRLGVSDPVAGLKRTEVWLPIASVLIAGFTALLTLLFVLVLPRDDVRTAVAFAPAAAAWGLACLADDQRRLHLRLVSLLLAGLSAVYLSWAQLGIESSAGMWLIRSFRLLMVLSILTFMYGLALPRWLLTAGVWNAATRKAGYVTGIAAVAAFIGVLLLEVILFQPGIGAPVEYPQVIAVAVVLLTMIAGLISMALLPGRDPLVLSEKGRQGYVYAALATAALLFAHLYVCRPMWFDAGLLPYWPLIVMAIAFAGAGGGELFARYRLTVLSEPLTRVSSMLPLLPVLGMWIVAPKETDYALVLLVVGVLYLMLSVTQKSWASLLAAAVAGNGALWTLLHRSGFELLANPQLWIIPPALSVLLAAHVNRRRLPPAALTSIRYACTLLIYVSSTSEIFLRGVATSLWPAMILATLSVAGAFVGMMLRIRAFLYLGASFALVSLITMVAHAAQAIDHVWPWWAFGVGMGIAILVLFGVFEKQREEVLRLIARLREWEQ